MIPIKRRERDAVIQSLQAGLVPRMGLHLIQVGRKDEVTALLKDIERIEQGGASFRIVVGRYGSGKTFFLNLIRTLALQKKVVVAQADFTMERRLYASGGQARALYSELMKNLATKSKPEGGALRNLCEGWISNIHHEIVSSGGTEEDVKRRIHLDLRDMQDLVGGFEFAQVLAKYYEGFLTGNDELQGAALRWFRGEFTTKTEAYQLLGVRRIISDENFYDSLKLMSAFCIKAGYSGLFVCLDEMVVLSHRLPNSKARDKNYEAILTILNDCFQGGVGGLGFLLAGTDECLEDKRRGLYSYGALQTRLAENCFAGGDVVDFYGPVLRLKVLTPEDLYILLQNIRHVHASGDESHYLVPNEALVAILKKANQSLGAEFYASPRDIVRPFVGLLNILEQNPDRSWQDFLEDGFFKSDDNLVSVEEEVAKGIGVPEDEEEDLETFRL